jgi:carbon monoxide dehydrogenase subunit G
MEFEGEVSIEGTETEIWDLISDPEALMTCVPGAEEIERLDERTYTGTVVRGIAGISVSMNGEVHLNELNPPNNMVAEVSGEDNRTGSRMDAQAEMTLVTEAADTTTIDYHIDMEFSGKLASIGSRILGRKIKSDINTYFDNVREQVENDE